MKKAEFQKIRNALDWVRASLDCPRWDWDGDQRECAEIELEEALEIIDRHHDNGGVRKRRNDRAGVE